MSYTFTQTGSEIQAILDRAEAGGQIDQDIAAKQDALTFDDAPTEGSDNPVKSGGIYDAIQAGGAAALAAFATDSVSGDVVSFPDGADGIPVKAFTGSILPAQSGSGDPSPSNVRPISGWTGAEITRCGINLVPNGTNTSNGYVAGKYLNSANGEVVNSGWNISEYFPILPDTQYTFKNTINKTSGTVCMGFYDADKGFISATPYNTSPKTFTTPPNAAYMRAPFYVNAVDGNQQINIGSTAQDYHAYNGQTILLTFGSTVYAGTLTALGGGLWKIQPTHALTTLSALSWSKTANGIFASALQSRAKGQGVYPFLSDTYKQYTGGHSTSSNIANLVAANGDGIYVNAGSASFYVADARYTDADTFKSDMGSVVFVYELATYPDPITITGEDLRTLLGANTVWTDVGSVTELEYRADTALYIQKLIGGGGTLQTLSMASPSPSLSLGRVGVLAEPEVSEQEQTEEEAEQTEQAEEE